MLATAALLLITCAKAPTAHAPHASRPASPPQATAPVQPVVAQGGPVLARALIADVSVVGDDRRDAWALVDGSAARALSSADGAVTLRVRFTRPERLESIAVHGPAGGTLTLLRDDDALDAALDGWSPLLLDRSTAWKRHRAERTTDVASLALRWTPAAATDLLPELEFLALSSPPRAPASGDPLVDRLLQHRDEGTASVAATPDRLWVVPGAQHRPTSTTSLTFTVDGDPRRFARAFLVYELVGQAHWTAVPHALNGQELGTAYRPLADFDGGLQVEEVAPTWLRRGANVLRFAPVAPNDRNGYRVLRAKLVTVAGDSDAPAVVADGPRAYTARAPSTVHEVDLRVRGSWSGALVFAAAHRSVPVATLTEGWHRVPVDPPVELRAGESFTVSSAGETADAVTAAHVVESHERAARPGLVVTWPLHGECVERERHVRGYVDPSLGPLHGTRLVAAGVALDAPVDDVGRFAFTLPVTAATERVALEAVLPDGRRVNTVVAFEDCAPAPTPPAASGSPRGAVTDDPGAPYGRLVRANRAALLSWGDVRVEIPVNALERDARITIRPLAAVQVHAPDVGMTVVSPGGVGVRFGPHGLRFKHPVHLTLPVDPTRIPAGMTAADVTVFHYNDALGRWQAMPRAEAQQATKVSAASEHFSDFVAATLAAPESPQAESFNPTMMRDLDPGNPAVGVPLIAAPEANASGSATLQHPIEVPPGRRGMQPSLAITYNSQQDNGPLGVGWGLHTSAIELDTRFGVPAYDGNTERYLLDGEALVETAEGIGDVKRFERRVEGRFDRILRRGTTASDYTWEVTDKNGVTSYYGTNSNGRLVDHRTSGIFRWGLQRVVDPFGNEMTWLYEQAAGAADGPGGIGMGEPWRQMYPLVVLYTAHRNGETVDLGARYTVQFQWEPRTDVISSARAGFDVRTKQRLHAVKVYDDITLVREYRLGYAEGAFGKSLLQSIALRGLGGADELSRHTFQYTALPTDGSGNVTYFSDPTTPWATNAEDDGFVFNQGNDLLEGGGSAGAGFSGFVGVGPPTCQPHVGGGVMVSGQGSYGSHTLADVNGDGVADMVNGNGRIALGRLLDTTGAQGQYELAANRLAPGHISDTEEATINATVAGHAFDESAAASADLSYTWNAQTTLFTDVNGDGLVDTVRTPPGTLITGSDTLAVRLNPFGFPREGFGVGPTLLPDYLLGGYVPVPHRPRLSPEATARLSELFHPVDTLVRWRWPLTVGGTVMITGAVQRRGPVGGEPEGADGVVVTIYRARGWMSTSTTEPIWKHTFEPGSTETCTPAPGSGTPPQACGTGLSVTLLPDDRLYFRVEGLEDPRGDTTDWDPRIEITSVDGEHCPPVSPQMSCTPVPTSALTTVYQFSGDFRLADPDLPGWVARANGVVNISGVLERPSPSMDLTVQIRRRHVVWANPSARPAWLDDPTHLPTAAEMQALVDAHAVGDVAFHDDPPIDFPFPASGATELPVDHPHLSVAQGDILYFTVLLPLGADPQGVRFNPEVRYTSMTFVSGTVTYHPNIATDCPLDEALQQRFCALSAPVPIMPPPPRGPTEVTRLPELFVRTIGTPSIGTRQPYINRAQPLVGGAQGPEHFSRSGAWGTWSYTAWNGNSPFSDGALMFLSDSALVARVAEARIESGLPYTAPSSLLLTAQWGASPLGRPGNTAIIAGMSGDLWATAGAGSYIAPGVMRPGRMGGVRLHPDGHIDIVGDGAGYRAIAPGIRQGDGTSGGLNATVGPGGSIVWGSSDGYLEFFDFNGDRLPDSIRVDGVQLQRRSESERGFEPRLNMTFAWDTLRRTSSTVGRISGVGSAASVLARNITAGGRHEDDGPSLPSFTITNGTTNTDIDFADLNGDGLPDHIKLAGLDTGGNYRIEYQLNLGRSLGALSKMTIPAVLPNEDGDYAASLGVQRTGTIAAQYGFAGVGGGPSLTASRVEMQMVDINGDGLADRVVKREAEGFFRVFLNTGEGFTAEQVWQAPAWPGTVLLDPLHNTYGWGGNAGGGGPIPFPSPVVCIIAELSVTANLGRTTTDISLTDIDGDGRMDHVLRDEQKVHVRRNLTAGVNLLRHVAQPLGGSFTLTYSREGNHVGTSADDAHTPADMPQSRQVLAAVQSYDGRGNTYTGTYEYFHSGRYDRVEREDYGFSHVRTTRRRVDASADSTVDSWYHNQDYYRRGRVYDVIERDGAGMIFRRAETTWSAPPMGISPLTGSFFSEASEGASSTYEGATADLSGPHLRTRTTRVYDAYGTVTSMVSFGDEATANDDVHFTVTPQRDLTRWTFRASAVEARDHAGALLRRRQSMWRSDGAMESFSEAVHGGHQPTTGAAYSGELATSTFDYDAYGNLTEAIDAAGFTLTYGYDAATHTHRTTTLDSFGYTSSSAWDTRWGVPSAVTDVNGNQRLLEYDAFGRVSAVRGPYDLTSAEPTVAYDYAIGSAGATAPYWVRVRNKDSSRPGDPVETVIFADGLGRVIQTKQDTEVDDGSGTTIVGRTVSGLVTFDDRGRPVRAGQPIFDNGPPSTATDLLTVPELYPTLTEYDVLSRVTRVTNPTGAAVKTEHATEALDGVTRLTTTTIDPLDHQRTVFSDARGAIVAVREWNTVEWVLTPFITHYQHDSLGQLTQVTDVNGNVTSAAYDSRGLMVSLDNPDTGLTTWRYTLAGDLAWRQTPVLRADGEAIHYIRTKHRLDRVEYPDSAPVVHTYGSPGATHNRAGRLVSTTNDSGTTTYRYGALGEVTHTTYELAAMGSNPALTAVLEQSYDSFGRMQTMQYPDGALLTYEYDAGGRLRRLLSARNGSAYTYVDRITYTEFGERARIRYGSGVETVYRYDTARRWLAELNTHTNSGAHLQQIGYAFRPDGNINYLSGLTAAVPGVSPGGSFFQGFSYDRLNQLTYSDGYYWTADTTRQYWSAQSYDAIGNVTGKWQEDRFAGPPTWAQELQSGTSYVQGYTYSGTRPHAPTAVGGRSFTYDANGNQTGWTNSAESTSRTLTWDEEDRVREITTNGAAVAFRYDAGGQRTHKQSSSGTSVYVGGLYTVRNGVVATRHVYAGDQRVASTVLPDGAAGTTENTYYYHTNHLQSTQLVTNGTGGVAEHNEYFPFGETWIDESNSTERVAHRFTGKEIDPETGLYYFGARYYDPQQSQWISTDPILATYLRRGLDPASLALFGYAFNGPVRMVDPNGQEPITATAVLGGAAVGAVIGLAMYVGVQVALGEPVRLRQAAGACAAGALTGATAPFVAAAAVLGPVPAFLVGGTAAATGESVRQDVAGEDRNWGMVGVVGVGGGAVAGVGAIAAPRNALPGARITVASDPAHQVIPVGGRINVGGGIESPRVSNLNPISSGPGASSIQNLVRDTFENIGERFAASAATEVFSSRLPMNGVSDWNAAASGTFRVLQPGGRVRLNIWTTGMSGVGEAMDALRRAGFSNVRSSGVGQVWIFAEKPST